MEDSQIGWIVSSLPVVYDHFTYMPALVQGPSLAPGSFSKNSPTNGTTGVATPPTLDWADASNATGYEYCYDLSVNGDCTGGWNSTGTISQVTLPSCRTTPPTNGRRVPATLYGTTYANNGTEWSFTTAVSGGSWTIVTSENFETDIPKTGWSMIDYGTTMVEHIPGKAGLQRQ